MIERWPLVVSGHITLWSRFMVPREGNTNFAEILEKYIDSIKQELDFSLGECSILEHINVLLTVPWVRTLSLKYQKKSPICSEKDNSNGFSFHS